MNKRAQLLYDFICMFDGLAVNRENCLVIDKTPELKYLLKHNIIKRVRNPKSFTNRKTTVLFSSTKRNLDAVFCPDCKKSLTRDDFHSIFNSSHFDYHKTNHKYNCSFRSDHRFDSHNIKQIRLHIL